MSNSNINKAKKVKDDEFYTRYEDIEEEINSYVEYNKDVFKNKIILFPCDNPKYSNFYKYFVNHYIDYNIKYLIFTYYKGDTITVYDGTIHKYPLKRDTKYEIGDFRSCSVTSLKDKADMVITNPPFSLARNFIKWINPSEKDCIVWSSNLLICKSNVREYWYKGDLFPGYISTESKAYLRCDNTYKRVATTVLTTLKHINMFSNLDLHTMSYNKEHGVHYSYLFNTNILNIDKSKDLPKDYNGIIGVPITFYKFLDQSKYKILGTTDESSVKEKYLDYSSLKKGSFKDGKGNLTKIPNAFMKIITDSNYKYDYEGTKLKEVFTRLLIKKKN